MRISDWSSDVCSSDLLDHPEAAALGADDHVVVDDDRRRVPVVVPEGDRKSVGRESVCQSVSISVVAVSLKKKHIRCLVIHSVPLILGLLYTLIHSSVYMSYV